MATDPLSVSGMVHSSGQFAPPGQQGYPGAGQESQAYWITSTARHRDARDYLDDGNRPRCPVDPCQLGPQTAREGERQPSGEDAQGDLLHRAVPYHRQEPVIEPIKPIDEMDTQGIGGQ